VIGFVVLGSTLPGGRIRTRAASTTAGPWLAGVTGPTGTPGLLTGTTAGSLPAGTAPSAGATRSAGTTAESELAAANSTSTTTGPRLIVSARVLTDLLSAPEDRPVLGSALLYETGGTAAGATGLDVVPTAIQTSEVTFATDAASPKWDERHPVVILDLEDWSLTPTSEIEDPLAAMQAAEAVAADHGLTLLPAPGLDLWQVLDPGASSGVTGYLGSDLALDAASVSPIIEVQAQSVENSPSSFARLVDGAIAQAAAERSGERVLVGISTNPPSGTPSAAVLAADVTAAYDAGAAGLWVNVPVSKTTCPTCGTPDPALAEAEVATLPTTGWGTPHAS